ncbi:MAG: Gfo/Idh/MocA family oxidoreductase [Clostridiales bacterium]|nr:Gfo/Idh/MocA family oxidoreductase [Clostridiales bacterium]
MDKKYNWAIIGCGDITNQFTQAMLKKGEKIYAVANRTYENAVKFAQKYNIGKVCKSPSEIFDDKNIDIVYIATPHNSHIEYIMPALESNKHILCEKAITLNSNELGKAIDTASKNNLILAEAMTVYHMPIYKKLNEIIKSENFEKLCFVQANLGSRKEYDMTNRFFCKELAGGAVLDIGVYALSFIWMFLSEKPTQILSQIRFAPSGVDEEEAVIMKNSCKESATAYLSLCAKQPKRATAVFEKACIEILKYTRADKAVITYTDTGEQKTITAGDMKDALLYEICDMEAAVGGGENQMYLEYAKDVMDIMTGLRNEWGLKYPEEE